MNNKRFLGYLNSIGACDDAISWVKENAPKEELQIAADAALAARIKTLKKCADIFRKHFPKLNL